MLRRRAMRRMIRRRRRRRLIIAGMLIVGTSSAMRKLTQADADKTAAQAQLSFTKLREDYRHDVNEKLADLDKKIADLDAKAKTLKAPQRTELESKLVDIRPSRQAFVGEYQAIESASALTWDDVKKRLDKSWNDLETKVSRA